MGKKGNLIILSGPSGVGKSTVRRELFNIPDLNLVYSVSMTTRQPRAGEVEGVDYFFVTKERFLKAIEDNELLEHADFVGNCYGTPKAYVDKLLASGKNVILEIEVEGAKQVILRCPDAISIFILPPSFKDLEDRIRGRRSEPEEILQQRLKKASYEMCLTNNYKHVIVNDSIPSTCNMIATIIREASK